MVIPRNTKEWPTYFKVASLVLPIIIVTTSKILDI